MRSPRDGRRRSSAPALVFAVLGVAPAGCNRAHERPAVPDAGLADAGSVMDAPDAGGAASDAPGSPSRPDAPRDAAEPDASLPPPSPCAAYVPPTDCGDGEPHWEHLGAFGPAVPLETARCPANVLSFAWEPCTVWPASCERAPLPGYELFAAGSLRWSTGHHDGARGLVVVTRSVPPFSIVGVVSTAGHALAMFRVPLAEGTLRMVVGGSSAALSFEIGSRWGVVHDHVDRLARADGPTAGVPDGSGLAVTDHLLAGLTSTGVDVAAPCGARVHLDPAPVPWTWTVALALVEPFALYSVHATGTHGWFDRAWVRYGSADRPAADYLVAEPGYAATDLVADAEDVAWTRLWDNGSSWVTPELWTARFVDDAAALEPRFVRALPHVAGDAARVGGGYYAFTGSLASEASPPELLHVVELATGEERTFRSPFAPTFTGGPAYLVSGEILLQSGGHLVRFDPRELFSRP